MNGGWKEDIIDFAVLLGAAALICWLAWELDHWGARAHHVVPALLLLERQ